MADTNKPQDTKQFTGQPQAATAAKEAAARDNARAADAAVRQGAVAPTTMP